MIPQARNYNEASYFIDGLGSALMLPCGIIQAVHFWQSYHRSDVASWEPRIRRYQLLTCPVIGDINFDHLLKVVAASYLYCKVTIFCFVNP